MCVGVLRVYDDQHHHTADPHLGLANSWNWITAMTNSDKDVQRPSSTSNGDAMSDGAATSLRQLQQNASTHDAHGPAPIPGLADTALSLRAPSSACHEKHLSVEVL